MGLLLFLYFSCVSWSEVIFILTLVQEASRLCLKFATMIPLAVKFGLQDFRTKRSRPDSLDNSVIHACMESGALGHIENLPLTLL